MQHLGRWTLLGLGLVVLSGCGGTAEALGFGRNAPDEFAVVERPPLSMPPDYDLRPPRPGAPRPQEVSMTDRASEMMFGETKKSMMSSSAVSGTSDSEKALLASAGADKAQADIRSTIDREAAQKVSGSDHLVENLLWWRDPSATAGTTVDAAAEAKRLKEAKEKGGSVNSGATPVIEKGNSGWLGL